MGVIPDELVSDSSVNVTDVFGGIIDIKNPTSYNNFFTIELHSLPSEACMALATTDWGNNQSSGVVGVTITERGSVSYWVVEYVNTNCSGEQFSEWGYNACADSLPMSPAKAAVFCKNNADLSISFSK